MGTQVSGTPCHQNRHFYLFKKQKRKYVRSKSHMDKDSLSIVTAMIGPACSACHRTVRTFRWGTICDDCFDGCPDCLSTNTVIMTCPHCPGQLVRTWFKSACVTCELHMGYTCACCRYTCCVRCDTNRSTGPACSKCTPTDDDVWGPPPTTKRRLVKHSNGH